MLKDNKKNLLFRDFPEFKATEELKEHPENYHNCDVRIRMGMFYTEQEKQKYINDSLNRVLPGEEKAKKLVRTKIK